MLSHTRRGSGEPLLLIHGIGSRLQFWDPVVDRLAATHEVIALDLPGFGHSPPLPPERNPSPQELASAVAEFAADLGLVRPVVAGNSLGGAIALELAKRAMPSRIVTFSPAGFAEGWDLGWLIRYLAFSRATARRTRRFAGAVRLRPVRAAAFGVYIAKPGAMEPGDAVASLRNLADSPGFPATHRELGRYRFRGGDQIDVPVTIAWGMRDRLLLPRRQLERAEREIPQARIVRMEGAGHLPTYDHPDRVTGLILAD